MALPVGQLPCARAGRASELPRSRAPAARERWIRVRRCMDVSWLSGQLSKARLDAGEGRVVLLHLCEVIAIADAAAQVVVVQAREGGAVQRHAQAGAGGNAQAAVLEGEAAALDDFLVLPGIV